MTYRDRAALSPHRRRCQHSADADVAQMWHTLPLRAGGLASNEETAAPPTRYAASAYGCRGWDSNPHGGRPPSDFKSDASAVPPPRLPYKLTTPPSPRPSAVGRRTPTQSVDADHLTAALKQEHVPPGVVELAETLSHTDPAKSVPLKESEARFVLCEQSGL